MQVHAMSKSQAMKKCLRLTDFPTDRKSVQRHGTGWMQVYGCF